MESPPLTEPREPAAYRSWVPAVWLVLALLSPPDTNPVILPLLLGLAALFLATAQGLLVPPGTGALLAFLAVLGISLGRTPSPGPGLELGLGWLLGLAGFLMASAADPARFARLAVPLAAFHGVHAEWQRLVLLPELARSLEPGRSPTQDLILQRAAGARAFSTLSLPGHLGALLVALVPFLVAELVRGETRARRTGAAVGLAGVAMGVHATAALGAVMLLLALVAGGLLLSAPVGRRLKVGLVALVVLLGLGVVRARLPDLLDPASRDNPLAPRLRMWERATRVIAEGPLTGSGAGSYPVVWLAHARPGDVPARNAHQSYLEIAAELGAPALVLLLLFLLAALRASGSMPARAGALVLLLHGSFDFDLQSPALRLATLSFLGYAVSGAGRRLGPRLRLALVLLLGVATATAGARERGRVEEPPASTEERIAVLEEALSWWPLDARNRGERAAALLESGDRDGALDEVARARRLEPRTAWLAKLEGDVHVARNESLAAYLAYREAARLYPARGEYRDLARAVADRLEALPGPGGAEPGP